MLFRNPKTFCLPFCNTLSCVYLHNGAINDDAVHLSISSVDEIERL